MSFPVTLDDAAVFPPRGLPLGEAVAEHRVHRTARYAELVGPLVVSLDHLADPALDPRPGTALDLAVVVADAAGAAEALVRARTLPGARVVALEVTEPDVPALQAAIGQPAPVTVYVELPRDDRRSTVLAALAGTPYRAKLRTGGVRADLHPDEAELAAAVVALVAAGVPFKATAGLHHALRNTDPTTGFEQHGFLNLLAATAAATRGAHVGEVAAVLAARTLDELPSHAGGALLCSIGTCSITDPVADLEALGILAGAR